jgi:hypothetical protein
MNINVLDASVLAGFCLVQARDESGRIRVSERRKKTKAASIPSSE